MNDELREQILTEFKQVHKLAPADYTENCTNVVMALVAAHTDKAVKEARIDELENLQAHEMQLHDSPTIKDRLKELQEGKE